jgi:glucose/arabinose dehydrogenase
MRAPRTLEDRLREDRMMRRSIAALAVLGLIASAPVAEARPGDQGDPAPRVPLGFVVTPYSHMGGTGSSLDVGPDGRLYVADNSGDRIMVIEDQAGVGGPPKVFATGINGPLGVLAASDGNVYVAGADAPRNGPFGNRAYGFVRRLRDTDGDGDADTNQVVVQDLPNGRHNTNGMAIGPDGMLYVTNGSSTDDGVEGGSPEVKPWSGSVVRVDPAATGMSAGNFTERDNLVAAGMRNVYDVAFSPVEPSTVFIPMNGADDARPGDPDSVALEDSDDLLYGTDVDDVRTVIDPVTGAQTQEPIIDDFGFPSCLYNLRKKGNLEPYDNPNPATIARYGACPKATVPRPAATFGLHVSADGAAFQTTGAWGADYKNDLFVAEFGNFFGDRVMGHRVVHVELDETGTHVVRQSEFLSGPVPLDVTFDAAGAMYVLSFSGAIFKVTRAADVPRTVDVSINAYQFLPAELTIPEGTVVRWTNDEALGLLHEVASQAAIRADGTQDTGREIDSGTLTVGTSHSYRFDDVGTWVYTCRLGIQHEALMHGRITVVPAGG